MRFREAFMPYLESSFEEVLKVVSYPHEDIKKAAVDALMQFTVNFSKIETPEGKAATQKALSVLIPRLSELIRLDEERDVVIQSLDSLSELLDQLKTEVIVGYGHKDAIRNIITDVMSGKIWKISSQALLVCVIGIYFLCCICRSDRMSRSRWWWRRRRRRGRTWRAAVRVCRPSACQLWKICSYWRVCSVLQDYTSNVFETIGKNDLKLNFFFLLHYWKRLIRISFCRNPFTRNLKDHTASARLQNVFHCWTTKYLPSSTNYSQCLLNYRAIAATRFAVMPSLRLASWLSLEKSMCIRILCQTPILWDFNDSV